MELWYQLQPLRLGWALLPPVALLYLCGCCFVALYRLFFHPLSRFPGPRKAAATGWYLTYYDVWKQGAMAAHVAKLHEKYGPIVRIGPNYLHFSDPSAYHTIYSQNTKFLKDPWLYALFDAEESVFGYIDPRAAKGRRDVLSPLFSHRAIASMQGLIAEKFDKLCDKLGEYSDTGRFVNLSSAYRSATVDIIMTFCFAQCMDALDHPGFKAPVLRGMRTTLEFIQIFKHFHLIKLIVLNIPQSVLGMSSRVVGFVDLSRALKKQLDNFLSNPSDLNHTPHPIIYNRLLDPSVKGASDAPATPRSLFQEANTMLFAGADTVAATLSVGSLNILNNPTIYETLLAELMQAWPNLQEAPTYEDLEKLPYLTAVIKESLRTGGGVVSLLGRVVPATGAVVDGEYIPGGTVVAMGSTTIHRNEDIFPNSQGFVPERCLGPNVKDLDKYLVSFSKGQRQCLGINLAYCELYLGFARLFRRFEFMLDGTIEENMVWRDCFPPMFADDHLRGFIKRRDA